MDSAPGGEAELARVDEVPFVDEANFSNGSQVRAPAYAGTPGAMHTLRSELGLVQTRRANAEHE